MPAHGLLNPWNKITAGNESISTTCGLTLEGPVEPSNPHQPWHKLPPPSPLPGTNNTGTDALLNSSAGFDA